MSELSGGTVMTAMRRRRREVAVAGVAGALMLGGCSETQEASDLVAPSIVWEKGEPEGSWWDTEWAGIYREAAIQRSLADAYGDYSDPDFVATFGYDDTVAIATANARFRFRSPTSMHTYYDDDAMWAFYGAILDIEESADGKSAVVHACGAGTESDPPMRFSVDWTITKFDDGSHHVQSAGGHRNQDCQDVDVWIGAWVEPIDIENVGRDEVKMPLPREYYVELGVIPE